MDNRLFRLLSIFIWIIIWYVMARIINMSFFLPGPYDTFRALIELLKQTSFYTTVWMSLIRIMASFGISVAFGLMLGIPSALSKKVEIFLEPFVTVMKSTPVMSFILIFILWFRLDIVPAAVGIVMCFPVVYKNVVEGIKNIDNKLIGMARIYRVSKSDILKGIYIKSIKPYLYSSMNVSLGLAFRVVVAAEVLANPKYGIGSRLYGAKVYFETEEMFAWTFVIIVLSYLLEIALKHAMVERGGKF